MSVICIKFNEGPHKGQYGYFSNSTADAKVKEGVAEYYDPSAPEKPNMDNTKKEIIAYLDSKGFEYEETLTKSELLDVIDG